jgi:hypothetical protein
LLAEPLEERRLGGASALRDDVAKDELAPLVRRDRSGRRALEEKDDVEAKRRMDRRAEITAADERGGGSGELGREREAARLEDAAVRGDGRELLGDNVKAVARDGGDAHFEEGAQRVFRRRGGGRGRSGARGERLAQGLFGAAERSDGRAESVSDLGGLLAAGGVVSFIQANDGVDRARARRSLELEPAALGGLAELGVGDGSGPHGGRVEIESSAESSRS